MKLAEGEGCLRQVVVEIPAGFQMMCAPRMMLAFGCATANEAAALMKSPSANEEIVVEIPSEFLRK